MDFVENQVTIKIIVQPNKILSLLNNNNNKMALTDGGRGGWTVVGVCCYQQKFQVIAIYI